MKKRYTMIVITTALIGSAFAQEYTTENGDLVVSTPPLPPPPADDGNGGEITHNPYQPSPFSESFVNRYGSITLNEGTSYEGDHVNLSHDRESGSPAIRINGQGTFRLDHSSIDSHGVAERGLALFEARSENGGFHALISNTKISAPDGNFMERTVFFNHTNDSGSENMLHLDNVNFDLARNQLITSSGTGNFRIMFSGNTQFHGAILDGGQSTSVNINMGASWNVTADQNRIAQQMGREITLGEVHLDMDSMIIFDKSDLHPDTFTNINAAFVMIQTGSILMLGATADEIQDIIDRNQGTYEVELFTGGSVHDQGSILMTSDNQQLEYTTNGMGTYMLTNVMASSIPEPATATLGLTALGLLTLRRRK